MTTTQNPPAAQAEQAGEALSIRAVAARLDEIARANAAQGSSEGFLASLENMKVGEGDQQKVAEAQQASKLTGAAWASAARTVAQHNEPLSEAYSVSPDAANKHANTNE
jgi:hypothetical protein